VSEQLTFNNGTSHVLSQPPCCPDVYLCLAGDLPEVECPRHGGFDVCCDQPDRHVHHNPEAWHALMDRWEQHLLNLHIQRFKVVTAFFDESDPYVAHLLSTDI
jgi:hypothetical protein